MSDIEHDLADRIAGAYIGAALGDALGGPVEGWHAVKIREVHGRVDRLLPYDPNRYPQYMLHPEPGSVTDDTFIRADIAGYVLDQLDPRTPETLAAYLRQHAHFERWWQPPLRALRRVWLGLVSPEDAGQTHPPGGGLGWWTSVGLVWAGRPEQGAAEVRRLSAIWKQPLEQFLAGAVQAGTAAAVMPGADVDAVVEAARSVAGPLGGKLIDRAVDAARSHPDDLDALIDEIYASLLVRQVTNDPDGPMPPPAVLDDPEQRIVVSFFAEQLPVALAALVFGQGDFRRTMTAVASIGLDTDSIATTCGTWVGGLVGFSAIPADWVETLVAANPEVDLLADARALAKRAAETRAGTDRM